MFFFCVFYLQYVKVAMGQKDVMELGGNLPDSLSQYLRLGYQPETDAAEDDIRPEDQVEQQQTGNEDEKESMDNQEDDELEKDKLKVGWRQESTCSITRTYNKLGTEPINPRVYVLVFERPGLKLARSNVY